jgi:hypothetical protein
MAHRILGQAGRWPSREAFERYCQAVFANITFRGRRVLDVGGGIGVCRRKRGHLSGTRGSWCNTGTSKRFDELARELVLTNTRVETVSLQDLAYSENCPFQGRAQWAWEAYPSLRLHYHKFSTKWRAVYSGFAIAQHSVHRGSHYHGLR